MKNLLIIVLLAYILCQQNALARPPEGNHSIDGQKVTKNDEEKQDSAQNLLREHSADYIGAQRFISGLFIPNLQGQPQIPQLGFIRDTPNTNNYVVPVNRVTDDDLANFDDFYDDMDDDEFYEDYLNDYGPERNSKLDDEYYEDERDYKEYNDDIGQDRDNNNDNDDDGNVEEEYDDDYKNKNNLDKARSIQTAPIPAIAVPSIPAVSEMSNNIGGLFQNTMSAFSGFADQKLRMFMNMSSSAGKLVGDTTNSISKVLGATAKFTSNIEQSVMKFDEVVMTEELRLIENTKSSLSNFLSDLATISTSSARAFRDNPSEAKKFIKAQNELIDATRESYVEIFEETARGISELARDYNSGKRNSSKPRTTGLLAPPFGPLQVSFQATPIQPESSESFLTRMLQSASESVRVMANLTKNLSRAIELSASTRDPAALQREVRRGTKQIRRASNRLRRGQRQNVRQILRRRNSSQVRRRTNQLRRRRTNRRGVTTLQRRNRQRQRQRRNRMRAQRRRSRRRRQRQRAKQRRSRLRRERTRRRNAQRRRQRQRQKRRREQQRRNRRRNRRTRYSKPTRSSQTVGLAESKEEKPNSASVPKDQKNKPKESGSDRKRQENHHNNNKVKRAAVDSIDDDDEYYNDQPDQSRFLDEMFSDEEDDFEYEEDDM